jgi:hypothetical protein
MTRHSRVARVCRPGLVLTAVAVLVPGGCGAAKCYPVRGKVLVFEAGLLKEGEIRFQSVSDPALVGTGAIRQDGSFSMATPDRGDGLLPGSYRVAVVVPRRSGSPLFHERYQHFDTSDLRYTVTARDENYFIVVVKRSG